MLIHDAARPLASRELIDGVIAALEKGARGAAPMLAVADTLRREETRPDGNGWTLVPRDDLYRAQTPQGFRFAEILQAHRQHATTDVTDDFEMAVLAGIEIEAVAGEETQFESDDGKGFRPGGKASDRFGRDPQRHGL